MRRAKYPPTYVLATSSHRPPHAIQHTQQSPLHISELASFAQPSNPNCAQPAQCHPHNPPTVPTHSRAAPSFYNNHPLHRQGLAIRFPHSQGQPPRHPHPFPFAVSIFFSVRGEPVEPPSLCFADILKSHPVIPAFAGIRSLQHHTIPNTPQQFSLSFRTPLPLSFRTQ